MLVLFKSVENAHKAVMLGFPITSLQIGGLGSGTDKKMISNELSINEKEAKMLLEIAEKGINVNFQVTPKDPKIALNEALASLD